MKKINTHLIGISGVAGAGKDTLYRYISYILTPEKNVVRVALADALKSELDSFLVSKLGISAFTTNRQEKSLIRPLLVEYARIRRLSTNGTYWTNLIQTRLDEAKANSVLSVITDIRYAEYENDEVVWLKKQGGILIHLSQMTEKGEMAPANEDEARNDPIVRKMADYTVSWPTVGKDFQSIIDYMNSTHKKDLLKLIS